MADEENVRKLLSGDDTGFLKLEKCYWYNDADDEAEDGKELGTFERLGHNAYSNFTGQIFVRCSTIINISYLNGGYESEPKS
jgi:hypothetical protein